MKNHKLENKLIGEVLVDAGLVSEGQVAVALMEQGIYTDLKLGEIFVYHGWINETTANFFGNRLKNLTLDTKLKIGEYLIKAGLLTENDILAILKEQIVSGIKFGSLAVLRGCIKQKTLDFFLEYIIGNDEKNRANHYTYNNGKQTINNNQQSNNSTFTQKKTQTSKEKLTVSQKSHEQKKISSYEELVEEGLEDIPWLD